MKAKAAAAGKDKKKAVIAKSLIVWEVKPWEAETNLDDMAKLILAIKIDGLEWKTEYKKEPVAFGVFKLVIGAVVEDEKVSTDDVQERIESFEDYV
jgi:elongation factor 1-beta